MTGAQRNEMWKLLYNVVSKSQTDLNAIFAFVDDILCREPSLIRPYSLRQQENRIQDTFVEWLINEFVFHLSRPQNEHIHITNVNLQKRILSSCFVNRSILFQRLVFKFVAAIDELAVEQPDESNCVVFQLQAFCSNEQCLKRIDSKLKFQELQVQATSMDSLLMHFLSILEHALEIGYEPYPDLFISSLAVILKAFQECVLKVKLHCLSYCHTLLKVAVELTSVLDYYYKIIVEALAILWDQVPMWIRFNCVQNEDLQNCADITASLLDDNSRFIKESSYKSHLIQFGYNILANVSRILEQKPSDYEGYNLHPVQLSLTAFIVHLQQLDSNILPLNDEQTLNLSRIAEHNPNVWRVVAVTVSQHNSEFTHSVKQIEEHINLVFAHPLTSSKYYEFTKELLHLLIYVEQEHFRQRQFDLLSRNKSINNVFESNYLLDNYFMRGKPLEEKKKQINVKVETLLKNANQDNDLYTRYMDIIELLLQISSFRRLLLPDSLKYIIDYLVKPIKSAMNLVSDTNFQREDCYKAMQILAAISLQDNSELSIYLSDFILLLIRRVFVPFPKNSCSELRNAFLNSIDKFILNGCLNSKHLVRLCLPHLTQNVDDFARVLKILCCTMDSSHLFVFYIRKNCCVLELQLQRFCEIEIVCTKCTPSFSGSTESIISFMKKKNALLMNPVIHKNDSINNLELLSFVRNSFSLSLYNNEQFSFVLRHFEINDIAAASLKLNYQSVVAELSIRMLELFVQKVSTGWEDYMLVLSQLILDEAYMSLKNRNVSQQLRVLDLISACTGSDFISEQWLFQFFKITFFFLVHPNSFVAHQAVLCATEMCYKKNVKPIQLWHWYKRDALNLVVKLAINVYLRKGVRLTRSLKMFTKMLGFSCVQEFICKYYRLLTTMILPFCVKEPKSKGLIVCISKVTRKPIAQVFIASFLRIYSHIYLTENSSIGNKCIDLIVKCSSYSLTKLMNADVKQTVSEFLIYFNRNPKFVMQAFQCLFLNETTSSNAASSLTTIFAKFIADRFLGVITYFETCLGEPNFEKSLKEEALYSLGQIIRFVGATHVTKFRFKIIAMLAFVLTLNDKHLQCICLKIWNIFLHIVNIEKLGPSLSRIVACLQPLLNERKTEVNSIYDFIILKNDNLLGAYIPDLYFLENIPEVAADVRQCVARQLDIFKNERSTIMEKLQFLLNQIHNENVQVRIYGLLYMSNFIAENRDAINRMISEEINVDPLMLKIVDTLVIGIRHENKNLQLAFAKCLGELGAIDPSYILSNYSLAQTNDISLSIHTDEFAVIALTELCRAYQFQKDSKYVDNFSLAIQETLLMCGVSPKDNEKMNVWEAIPERMRPIMKPLLSSCYTGSTRESKCKEHPIFNSTFCRSYEEWAFAWASRLIDFVQTEQTKHLLNSYKPSIKRDSNTLALIFPYIITHALQDCTLSEMQIMFEEFEVVFTFCARNTIVTQPEYETSGFKEFMSIKYLADRSAELSKDTKFKNKNDIENLTFSCSKLCSEQIDFLQRWLREWQRSSIVGGKLGEPTKHLKCVENFVKKFDKNLIAQANYKSAEFARALMYLEAYIEEDLDNRLQDQLSFLIEIHGKLMDADSVEGAVYMKKTNLSLTEEILVNKIVDRPQEAIACYEQLMSSEEQIHQNHIKGMLNCYLRMDIPETALLIADGLWQKLTDHYTDDYFKECKSELLWRLCRYDDLQEILDDSVVRRKATNWNIQCAEAFLLFRQPQFNENSSVNNFSTQIDIIRSNILCTMRNFSAVMYNSYINSYDEVIKFHILREVEKCKILLSKIENNFELSNWNKSEFLNEVQDFFVDWDARLCILQPIVRVIEPILCFRRNLLIEIKRSFSNKLVSSTSSEILSKVNDLISNEIGKLWIRSAQINRFSGNLQQAHLSIMKADEYSPNMIFLEKAKLLWDKGDQCNSFKLIQEHIERIEVKCRKNIRNLDVSDQCLYAEAKFLQATYNAESMNICSELNLRYFKEAILGNKHSEKCYVHLAQYIEKIYESFTPQQKDGDNGQKQLLNIMLNYARSLKCGVDNVYQSMPRLLSIWLDFTSRCAAISETSTAADSANLKCFQDLVKRMNDLITNCNEALPTWTFYTAFSQLLSRICHPSNEVFYVLRSIVVKLLLNCPHQSLWMLLPTFKSSYTNRVKRCRLILTDTRLSNAQFQKLLTDFNMLAERLIELTNKDVPIERSYELSSLVKQLPNIFKDPSFSKILLPFEKYMQVSLPISSLFESQKLNFSITSEGSSSPSITSNPFPYEQIYITGIKEEVIVLRSAAKPKKITLQCNDGLHYEVMVKPKDDLRKDFRLMEFNGLVKRFLHQDPQARYRRLLIRTYAAIPFNEECGLVEWLPNLNSFRNICMSIYRIRGLGIKDNQLRKFALPQTDTIEKKRSVFVETLLPRHPPVFHEWIRQRFPTPHSWYEARSSYVKTIAVMSMVGYILGLGDRHGENILFDEMNGNAVHVDFNCLFNQGESFAYPELVPFRLTHNMVFAMGPLNVEGMYRKCCEITLRLLKKETKTLMSVLKPFVYDLVVLNRSFSNKKPTGAELTDPKAMNDVRRIEERLQGYVNKTLANSMPLSIEGQVNFLISEATNVDNLASMYIGWGSYI